MNDPIQSIINLKDEISRNNLNSCLENINPLILITNPHAVCKNEEQNICDQISSKRRNQFIQSYYSIPINNEIELVISNERSIISLIPKIHRSIIDLNRNISMNTFHFKIFQYLLEKYPKIILLDIHSYPGGENWGRKADQNTDLVLFILRIGMKLKRIYYYV